MTSLKEQDFIPDYEEEETPKTTLARTSSAQVVWCQVVCHQKTRGFMPSMNIINSMTLQKRSIIIILI